MVAALAGCNTVDPVIGTAAASGMNMVTSQIVMVIFCSTVSTDVMVSTEQQVVAMSVDSFFGE
jgi:hypothetical protein